MRAFKGAGGCPRSRELGRPLYCEGAYIGYTIGVHECGGGGESCREGQAWPKPVDQRGRSLMVNPNKHRG